MSFVYKEDGSRIVKQEVVVGATSNEAAEIKAGLKENEQVYISIPPDAEKLKLNKLPENIKSEHRKKKESEAQSAKESSFPAKSEKPITIVH
jgi:uncharacterized protein YpmB